MQCCRATTQTRLPAGQRRSVRLVVRASDGHSTGAFKEGQRVKITKAVKIFHAPKAPKEGIQLEGLEGVVVKDVSQFKGKVLSANFPYYVELTVDVAGKPTKVKVHLGEEELAAL